MRHGLVRRLAIWVTVWSACGLSRSAMAESYHVLIFASQSHPKQHRHTHAWATFLRLDGDGSDSHNQPLQAHTISWVPSTLEVRVLTCRPEPGLNLDLHQTFAAVLAQKEHVTMWGPFSTIDPPMSVRWA